MRRASAESYLHRFLTTPGTTEVTLEFVGPRGYEVTVVNRSHVHHAVTKGQAEELLRKIGGGKGKANVS